MINFVFVFGFKVIVDLSSANQIGYVCLASIIWLVNFNTLTSSLHHSSVAVK